MILLGAIPPRRLAETESERLLSSESERAAKSFLERPEITRELKKQGLDKELGSEKEMTYAWRIRFGGANIYHVDRWRKMKGGQVFYDR